MVAPSSVHLAQGRGRGRGHLLLLQLPVLVCRAPQGAHAQTVFRGTLGFRRSS